MNYIALINFQRIIFSILFILSGLYLIIVLLKEILMLFIPRKHTIQELTELLSNDKNIKIIPLTTTRPEIKSAKESEVIQKEYVKPEVIKKKYKSTSPSVINVKKIKKEKRKSRKRNDDN